MLRLIFFLLSTFQLLFATLTLHDNQAKIENFQIPYLYDDSNTLEITQISKSDFNKHTSNRFAFGYVQGTTWFKFTLLNQSQNEDFVLSFTNQSTDIIHLYRQKDENWEVSKSGLFIPLKDREFYSSSSDFKLHIPQDQNKTYYIKHVSKLAELGTIKIYTLKAYHQPEKISLFDIFYIYFGISAMLLVMSAFLFISLKDRLYGYYLAYIFTYSLFILFISGLYVHFELPSLRNYLLMTPPLTTIFLSLFSMRFLKLKEQLPKLYLALFVTNWIYLIFIVLIFIDYQWFAIMNDFSTIPYMLLFISAIILGLRGSSSARYYLLALSTNLIGIGLMANIYTAHLPNSDFNHYFFLLTSLIENIFFVFLLARKFAQQHTLEIQVNQDALTQLFNRRYLMQVSEHSYNLAKRYNQALSLIIVDVDHFKNVNDNYGHSAGDKVLIVLANILQTHSRKSDIVARYGGEEFVILLPRTSQKEALILAQKIRQSVEEVDCDIKDCEEIKITISLGLAELNIDRDKNIEGLFNRADRALYEAKNAGRNAIKTAL